MSINQEIVVKDPNAAIEAHKLTMEETNTLEIQDDNQLPAIDKSGNMTHGAGEAKIDEQEIGDYEGRKNQPNISGIQQASQETDEVYADPRDTAGLPPAGKNVGELTIDTLGRD